MNDFINIDDYKFANAVAKAIDWTHVLSPLEQRLTTLELNQTLEKEEREEISRFIKQANTDRGLANLQFDSDDNVFNERVLEVLRNHWSYVDEDDVETIVSDYDISDKVHDAVGDIDFTDYVDEQFVKDALGLSFREDVVTTDNLSDLFFANVDMSDYVTSDDFNERLNDEVMSRYATHDDVKANFEALRDEVSGPKVTPQALCAIQTAITCLTEQVLRIQNLCGMTHSQDLLDAVMRVNEAMNTTKEVR